jgi:hypothetical protein
VYGAYQPTTLIKIIKIKIKKINFKNAYENYYKKINFKTPTLKNKKIIFKIPLEIKKILFFLLYFLF